MFTYARLISKVFKPGVGFMRAAASAAVCVEKSYLFENLPGSRYWNRTLTITYLTPGVETGNRLKILRICIDNRKRNSYNKNHEDSTSR